MQGSSKKRLAVIAVVLAMTTLATVNAMANRHGGPPGRPRMLGKVEHGVEKLELAPETRKSVEAILDEARSQLRALRDQLHAAHEQMRTALDAESPSTETVLAQAESIGALETQAKKLELQAILGVRQLLTAEQWKQLRAQAGPRRECRHDDHEKPA